MIATQAASCVCPFWLKTNVGGQKRRWNDVVLVISNSITCCNPGRRKLKSATLGAPSSNVVQSISTRKQKTKRRASGMTENDGVKQRLVKSVSLLHCNQPGCSFQAFNKAGLISHQCCHSVTLRIPCQFCHQLFKQHGLYNRQCFCRDRP